MDLQVLPKVTYTAPQCTMRWMVAWDQSLFYFLTSVKGDHYLDGVMVSHGGLPVLQDFAGTSTRQRMGRAVTEHSRISHHVKILKSSGCVRCTLRPGLGLIGCKFI